MTYVYQYLRVEIHEANAVLAERAAAGWRVHTFNRNQDASIVDILLEREVQ